MLGLIRVAPRQVDRARRDPERRRVVQVRLEHPVLLAWVGAVLESELCRTLVLVVDVVGSELVARGGGDVEAEIDVEPQVGNPGQLILAADVPGRAIRRCPVLRQRGDLERVVRRGQRGPGPVVVARRACRIVDRLGGPHLRRVRENAARREHVVLSRSANIAAQPEAIVEQVLLVVRAEGCALERRAQEDAVLVEIPQRQPPVASFGSVRQGKIVLLAVSRADHLAEPVGRGVPELRQLAGRAVLLDGGAEVCRVEHVGEAVHRGGGHVAGVLDMQPALSPLGRDEHHTVRGVRSVNRGRGSVPQHGDILDVGGIDRIERVAADREPAAGTGAHRHPVDHIKRIAGRADGCGAADPDRRAAARLVGVLNHLDAGRFATDELCWADDAARVELRIAYR